MAVLRLRLRRGRARGTARGRRRSWRMIGHSALWPALAGIAVAVGLGVQVGESAIREINPIHFQGEAPPVRAIDPNAPPPTSPVADGFASAYGWAEGNAARQADSGFTDFDYVPQPVASRASGTAWLQQPAPVQQISLAPWRPGQVSAHPEIERYADYPIETKPRDEASRPAARRVDSAPEPAANPPEADPEAPVPADSGK
jgi:hypothetical protein